MSRSYNSESREAKAKLTKKRILDAAKSLFHTHGFEGVTIDQLAQAAAVSTPTIYALYQSKRGVLRALMDEALDPDQFEFLVKGAMETKSPQEHLKMAAKIARQIYDAEKAQNELFQGASVLSPELKEFEREREMRRYQRQEDSVLSMQKSLKHGLTLIRARDILWAFTGRDMYRMLVIDKGWTSDEYEEWIGAQLIQSLLREVK